MWIELMIKLKKKKKYTYIAYEDEFKRFTVWYKIVLNEIFLTIKILPFWLKAK